MKKEARSVFRHLSQSLYQHLFSTLLMLDFMCHVEIKHIHLLHQEDLSFHLSIHPLNNPFLSMY